MYIIVYSSMVCRLLYVAVHRVQGITAGVCCYCISLVAQGGGWQNFFSNIGTRSEI